MTTTWTALAGDTSVFAIEISFIVDHEDHKYDMDEKESWGSLALWVDGINITDHNEVGEYVRATHWYLLPVIEWFVENWDQLLHEERLPLSNAGPDAASAMDKLLHQSLNLVRPDLDEFARYQAWQDWRARHCIVDAASGGIFPEVYLRRWGDLIEISVGVQRGAGVPGHFYYRNTNITHFAPVLVVATALHDVLTRAVQELRRRRPESKRLEDLERNCKDLSDQSGLRYKSRLASLSGVDSTQSDAMDAFESIWARVDEILDAELGNDSKVEFVGSEQGGLVLESAPQLALLFGSYSPSINADDIQKLLVNFHRALPHANLDSMPSIPASVGGLWTPGEEGSDLGERAYSLIDGKAAVYVDIEAILNQLGVTVSEASLSDSSMRAVSMVSETYGCHIVVNQDYLRGTSERVRRFTLAHEFGHILLDRSRSARLAIASGPWAPQAIEQRANAFAAAFLMPEELVARNLAQIGLAGGLANREVAARLAALLRVSVSSLAERVHNLLLITRAEADNLRLVE